MKGATKRPAPPRNNRSGNAFDLLMRKKRTETTCATSDSRPQLGKSRFVLCPVGCGSHVLGADINAHVDGCLSKPKGSELLLPSQDTADVGESRKDAQEPKKETKVDDKKKKGPSSVASYIDIASKGEPSREDSSRHALPEQDAPGTPNAFAHMMEQSHRVFSREAVSPLRQRFHLHLDGHISWTELVDSKVVDDPGSQNRPKLLSCKDPEVKWSSTVTLKGTRMMGKSDSELPPPDIELTVSSSFASVAVSPSPPGLMNRMVRRHSRLSVSNSICLLVGLHSVCRIAAQQHFPLELCSIKCRSPF